MNKSGFLTEPDTDTERQMTVADDNLLGAAFEMTDMYTKTFVPP